MRPHPAVKNLQKAIASSGEYLAYLDQLAKDVVRQAARANSEATIAAAFESRLRDALKWHAISFDPTREVHISSRMINRSRGRADSRFQNVVCEYKKSLTASNKDAAVQQLTGYIRGLAQQENQPLDRYVGYVTDGQKLIFVGQGTSFPDGNSIGQVTGRSLRELVQVYLSIHKKNLSAENLLADFAVSEEGSPSRRLARALYCALEHPSEKTFMLHSEWERLFRLAGHNENNLRRIRERNSVLAAVFDGLGKLDHARAVFGLQTAYTLIIKMVAFNTVSGVVLGKSATFGELRRLDSDALRGTLESVENGEIFSQLGIRNLLEGDFFSWYAYPGSWNREVFEAIRCCIVVLENYDQNPNLFAGGNLHDVFVDLYQSMIPAEVRHSLGEYYTPSWLAEKVISSTPKSTNWKGLDPCAGSGTFVLKLIKAVLDEGGANRAEILEKVLSRVKAIDINPLAVLTCRINYFIAIAPLLEREAPIEIPVYLGDSAFVPKIVTRGAVKLVSYSIETKKGPIEFCLPTSLLLNADLLPKAVGELESAIVHHSLKDGINAILRLVPPSDRRVVEPDIEAFVNNLIVLEKQNWDRIWVRIIIGFLKVATLGKFEVVVGNPPWIDWKALPDGYRETLKRICVERHLFSGDSFTGGINLNICALIANVVANNWVAKGGHLSFLMPKSIAFQQSYAGFRNLVQNDGVPLEYVSFVDWSRGGHPFFPVTEQFMTYTFRKGGTTKAPPIIPVQSISAKQRQIAKARNLPLIEVAPLLTEKQSYAFMNQGRFNAFTFEEDPRMIPSLRQIAGESFYVGRVGLGLYPKELLLFEFVEVLPRSKNLLLQNYQGKATEKKFQRHRIVVEPGMIHPVIEGPNVSPFAIRAPKLFAPFPYALNNVRVPLSLEDMRQKSPKLLDYYSANRTRMKKTAYNERVQGRKGAFYSLTRVGKYSFAPHRIVFRNNTKWVASVISTLPTPWGEEKFPLLLDHACSISESREGHWITADEAHYVCALLNSTLVKKFIENSSDSRSFRTELPIAIRKYDPADLAHFNLASISRLQHRAFSAKRSVLADRLVEIEFAERSRSREYRNRLVSQFVDV